MTSEERIDEAVDALLAQHADGLVEGDEASIESVLTAGYAHALELEAQRLRAADHRTITTLTDRVRSLRSRLDAVRRRYAAVGSARNDEFDRGPSARRRMDDELAT
jgi:hypothetical protein